jgi:formylglycine-generating enzyme required for sulfatase activity
MARLKIWHLTWGLLILTPMALPAQEGQRQDLASAGVCARCHVSTSLEWGISKHSTVTNGTRVPNCTGCHGLSKGHVADEQNGVKPDRIPRGDAIAGLCTGCHVEGCPKTDQQKGCQDCHHPHALVNPAMDPAAMRAHAKELTTQQDAYKARLAEGERLAQAGQWGAAGEAFRAALKENPASSRAKAAAQMCDRRLKPGIAGFKIVGDQFDAQSGLPKEIVLDGLGVDMVLIPAGSFDMGSERNADSQPVHSINVAAFYLGKFEMTGAEWKALMSTNPSFYQGEKYPQADKMPVEQVSWEDCQKMLAEINQKAPGGGFRLPTEAEWEYAARAGSSEPLPAAQVLRVSWLRENSEPDQPATAVTAATPVTRGTGGTGGTGVAPFAPTTRFRTNLYLVGSGVTSMPHPVGTREPNQWGLYDMVGNVSVWCSSLFMPYPYVADDGREAATGPGTRVVRGANFADFTESADPGLRHSERPDRRFRWNGVRLAFSPPEEGQGAAASQPEQKGMPKGN